MIVGGGVGGLVAAKRLWQRLNGGHRITVIDQSAVHVFQPSLLWVADGTRNPDRIARPLARLERRGITFRHGRVDALDPAGRRVRVDGGDVPYDMLVLAPGAELRPHSLPGLAESGANLYTVDGAAHIGRSIAQFSGGRVVVLIAALPFKCPAAPYEAAMLLEARLRRRGVRARNGKPLPKAGVFAEGEAEVVARNIASFVRGTVSAAAFDGAGECFLEMGDGRAGFATGNFYALPDPAVRLKTPGRRWHWAKVWFEKTWFPRWL